MAGSSSARRSMGSWLAPPRFITFIIVLIIGISTGVHFLEWRHGVMLGFDAAALVFLLSCLSLLDDHIASMRESARRNDANRATLLSISVAVSLIVLIVIATELSQKGSATPLAIAEVIVTLMLAWLFSNTVYALHYTHMFYFGHDGKDCGGLIFPETPEPNYWDFVYYAFCLGMTFQTSDVSVTDHRFRRVTTFHCLVAFIFNIGVLAFTINVLGGG